MAHVINYTAESDGIDLTTAKAIMDAVLGWADGDASHHFDGVAYDNVNNGMRISIRVTGVQAIDDQLSSLDTGVASINTNHGAGFPAPSESANVRPE